MSKEQNSDKTKSQVKRTKFKVAYSLNNWQPVKSTHISDQPFFYMEEEFDDNFLDEEFPSEFIGEIFENNINSIKQEIASLEDTLSVNTISKEKRLSEFKDDANFIADSYISPAKNINDLKDVLKQSDYGQALINSSHTQIIFGQISQKSFYDAKANQIVINQNLDETEQLLLLVMELRRAYQHKSSVNMNPINISPEKAILINRAQKADLVQSIIRCAWDLKLQRNNFLWNRLKMSSLSDLVHAFAREAKKDFRSLNNGKAASAVFESWFLSERAAYEDKILVQDMLADHKNYTFDEETTTVEFAILAITAIGAQPIGKNYLEQYAHFIAEDGLFTETRDRSTANFLWFIKFEHRFQEAERDLQSSKPIKINDTKAYQNKKIFEDTENASIDRTTNNVVCLFDKTRNHLQFEKR